jgi:hypothetical protein
MQSNQRSDSDKIVPVEIVVLWALHYLGSGSSLLLKTDLIRIRIPESSRFFKTTFFGGLFLPSLSGFPIQTAGPIEFGSNPDPDLKQWGHPTINTKKAHVPFHTGLKNIRESTGFGNILECSIS